MADDLLTALEILALIVLMLPAALCILILWGLMTGHPS